MIISLQTSDMTCRLWLDDRGFTWEAGRTLAHGLLGYIEECLKAEGKGFPDLTGLAVFRGPGSFTGLRIGIAVLNTIAASENLPIVGETGEDWRAKALARLAEGQNDRIILPEYGGDAHITTPKK